MSVEAWWDRLPRPLRGLLIAVGVVVVLIVQAVVRCTLSPADCSIF